LIEQILEARVRDNWDEHRNLYLDSLFSNVVGRVNQVQAESVSFLADFLAVAHKMHGVKLRAYLQTGNEEDLGDFKVNGFQTYKGALDALMKITGQDKQPMSPSSALPAKEINRETQPVRMLPQGSVQVMSASDAAKVLGILSDSSDE
jgi:hypothetical protein